MIFNVNIFRFLILFILDEYSHENASSWKIWEFTARKDIFFSRIRRETRRGIYSRKYDFLSVAFHMLLVETRKNSVKAYIRYKTSYENTEKEYEHLIDTRERERKKENGYSFCKILYPVHDLYLQL